MDDNATAVWRLLRALCVPDDVEDCFQETFISALRAYPRLANARNLRAWVLTIAERKAMDSHRARKRRPRPTADLPDQAIRGTDSSDPSLWAAVRDLPR